MLALLLALSVASDPPPTLPASITHRYRIAIVIHSTIDLTALGAPPQTSEQRLLALVTITLTDSAGGRALEAHLDSLTASASDPQALAEILHGAAGVTYHGFQDAGGRLHNLVSSGQSAAGAMLQSTLADFFPRRTSAQLDLPRWTDTLEVVTRPSGGELSAQVITTYTDEGRAAFEGAAANRVGASATMTMRGTMGASNGNARLSGEGSTVGNYYLSDTGTFLGGERTTTQRSTIAMEGLPALIPVTTTTTTVVTLLP